MFCLDVACNLFALTFNVIIFTMMLDGIKTRLNTNKREAGEADKAGGGGVMRGTNISCLIHLKMKANDICLLCS